jgi:hypothetical protein
LGRLADRPGSIARSCGLARAARPRRSRGLGSTTVLGHFSLHRNGLRRSGLLLSEFPFDERQDLFLLSREHVQLNADSHEGPDLDEKVIPELVVLQQVSVIDGCGTRLDYLNPEIGLSDGIEASPQGDGADPGSGSGRTDRKKSPR